MNSRKMTLSPLRQSAAPRTSLANDRRETRRIRDEKYKQNCIETVETFLRDNGYDQPHRPNTLICPSAKEFQSIFKFIYGFIDAYSYGKFEEDVISILKNLRYPYQNEITRSQLIAITPHTWPSVLSMLSWLIKLVQCVRVEENSTIESLFFDFVCEGFLRYCLGEEADDTASFEKETRTYLDREFENIEALKKETVKCEEELKKLKSNVAETDNLRIKKEELQREMQLVEDQKTKLQEKIKKHCINRDKLSEDLLHVENDLAVLKENQKKLQMKIELQEFNPDEVQKMNTEKIFLIAELKNLGVEKENLANSIADEEKELINLIEEAEKVIEDIKVNLKEDIGISLCCRDDLLNVGIDGNMDEILHLISTKVDDKRNLLTITFEQHERLKEIFIEQNTQLKECESKVEILTEKLHSVGRLYLERKDFFERERSIGQKEMEKLENELMQLKMESNKTLVGTQQSLQRAKIVSDRVQQSINYEKEEIQKVFAVFFRKMEELIKEKMDFLQTVD